MKLLGDDSFFGVDGLDDCRGEEGEALNRDVVCCHALVSPSFKNLSWRQRETRMGLLRRKIMAVVKVTGLRRPRRVLVRSILSRTSVAPTRSDFTLAWAKSFSSSVSHLAVSGRSVRVKKAMIESPHVMMPSIAKIIRHVCNEPNWGSFKMALASKPPKAPAKGAMTMYKLSRNASSLLRYQRDK